MIDGIVECTKKGNLILFVTLIASACTATNNLNLSFGHVLNH